MRPLRRTTALATLLLAGTLVAAPRVVSLATGEHLPAAALEAPPVETPYLAPPRSLEPDGFTVAELREALTGETAGYVDLGRFPTLRRSPAR